MWLSTHLSYLDQKCNVKYVWNPTNHKNICLLLLTIEIASKFSGTQLLIVQYYYYS